jgi:hypothetical protein
MNKWVKILTPAILIGFTGIDLAMIHGWNAVVFPEHPELIARIDVLWLPLVFMGAVLLAKEFNKRVPA